MGGNNNKIAVVRIVLWVWNSVFFLLCFAFLMSEECVLCTFVVFFFFSITVFLCVLFFERVNPFFHSPLSFLLTQKQTKKGS